MRATPSNPHNVLISDASSLQQERARAQEMQQEHSQRIEQLQSQHSQELQQERQAATARLEAAAHDLEETQRQVEELRARRRESNDGHAQRMLALQEQVEEAQKYAGMDVLFSWVCSICRLVIDTASGLWHDCHMSVIGIVSCCHSFVVGMVATPVTLSSFLLLFSLLSGIVFCPHFCSHETNL